MNELHRRQLLKAAGTAGAAASLLAACGGEDDQTDSPNGDSQGREETPSGEPDASEDESGSEGETGETGARVAVNDIPVGGGKILRDRKVVVTQPSEGEFKAFSAICTHNRCTVSTVSDGTINCDCHFSKFKVEDGSVVSGPAPRPLDEVSVTVEGGDVLLGD